MTQRWTVDGDEFYFDGELVRLLVLEDFEFDVAVQLTEPQREALAACVRDSKAMAQVRELQASLDRVEEAALRAPGGSDFDERVAVVLRMRKELHDLLAEVNS